MPGILVAVSIPIFTSQLEKAREATDLANMRAAKAAAVAAYLDADNSTADMTYYYDATNGNVVATKGTTANFKYGKGTTTVGSAKNTEMGYEPGTAYTDKCCKVVITAPKAAAGTTAEVAESVTVSWD